MISIFNDRNLNSLEIAFSSIMANKVRGVLTALGIIFGVAAIITMLAIGKGAEAEILEQLKTTGVNNIIINAIDLNNNESATKKEETENEAVKPIAQTKLFSKGLSLEDVKSIKSIANTVEDISPEAQFETSLMCAGRKQQIKLIGITSSFINTNALEISQGNHFNKTQEEEGLAVCIIGNDIKKRFFTTEDAIGKYIKCGNQWLKVVGGIKEKKNNKTAQKNFGIRDQNSDIYVPIQTLLIRYQNPAIIKPQSSNAEEENQKQTNHQIKRLTVKVKSSDDLEATAELITKLLKRRHNQVMDFEVIIPEILLKQEKKTKEIFSFVLSAIAGISLLVGGIGIMNIMLASVLERTKEIGTRLAIGAQKRDIIKQFLFEAILISLSGGIIGIVLGVSGALLVAKIAKINTLISGFSIIISFAVASGVGIIFGYTPAKKAANQNPIESLRYE
ncbi:ABC transporter permease [Solitalea koreensis]|uniref:Putative ABC transport system permease protein n=1 Tax=Solitalea koreensis TaxID=543615 RepID=A0A521BJQ2_9SPHI|nr:ABC transporter permease [Solitalea koreensis]SMO47378.1 putative ABC transport system permease protein [Solitalea koreensis]